MKTVFKSDEIAHIWANRGAPYGRSPGNASFDGNAFKSYATVIARRIEHGGKTAFIRDTHSFSVSTSKVSGRVWQAIPDSAKTFAVNCGNHGQSLNFTPATLSKHYEDRAAKLSEKMPSRYAFKRAEQYQQVTHLLQQARDVLAYWDMGTARLDKAIAKRKAGEATAADTLKEYRTKLEKAEAARKVRELKDRTARAIMEAEKFMADERPATRWLDTLEPHRAPVFALLPAELQSRVAAKVNASNGTLVARWLAGKDVSLPPACPTLLRVESEEMVTSHGARVPLTDAHRTYRFAIVCKAKGWHRNGETHAIGSYQLDAVNENGVVAGCHRVTWAEIERFAASQGWSK